MIVSNIKDIEGKVIDSPEVKNAVMKVLVSQNEGWEDHVMRIMELDENGYTPRHSHPWPHINFMVEGKGILHLDGVDHEVEQGSFAFVPADKEHQFLNRGQGKFKFICIVPKFGHK